MIRALIAVIVAITVLYQCQTSSFNSAREKDRVTYGDVEGYSKPMAKVKAVCNDSGRLGHDYTDMPPELFIHTYGNACFEAMSKNYRHSELTGYSVLAYGSLPWYKKLFISYDPSIPGGY